MKVGRPEGRLATRYQVVILGRKNWTTSVAHCQSWQIKSCRRIWYRWMGRTCDITRHRWWNGFCRTCSGVSTANRRKKKEGGGGWGVRLLRDGSAVEYYASRAVEIVR